MEDRKAHTLAWSEFAKVEMRVGTVVSAEVFKEARKLQKTLKSFFNFPDFVEGILKRVVFRRRVSPRLVDYCDET